MRSKKVINLVKMMSSALGLGYLLTSLAFAQEINCSHQKSTALKTVCSSAFQAQKQKLEAQAITAYMVTDAPLRLLQDTHVIWLRQLQRCKYQSCFQQQIDLRTDQLNFFASLNQSLTQHYLKVENGELAQKPIHIQIHRLNKNNIKIEGIAYLNPNNKLDRQNLSLLAYSTPALKSDIIDNNNDCKYHFKYSKAYLSVSSDQKGCEIFLGTYRLYD